MICVFCGHMEENLYALDQNNTIGARKSKKMTQAKMAEKLNMSLRRYTSLENTSEEVNLTSLELRDLSLALGVHPYMLLGDVPLQFTSHWKKLHAPSTFSEILFKSKGDLQVAGLPYNKKLRAALVEVVEIFEEKKLYANIKEPRLSETLKKRFRCDDLIEQLVGVGSKGIETLVTADLYALMVPKLEISTEVIRHNGEWTGIKRHAYEWSHTTDLLIDFDKTANDQPVTFDLIHGDDAIDFILSVDPKEHAKMVHEALEARPVIPVADDEHIFQAVAYKNPEPTVDDGHTTVEDGSAFESEKTTKQDKEEPG